MDHGGNLDAARTRFGGARSDWLDLSTGINPVPYPIPGLAADLWKQLPDQSSHDALVAAARAFWNVPEKLDVLPTHGASAPIAVLPSLLDGKRVFIPGPTYNEHAHAFALHGWTKADAANSADAKVLVHPNNPDGKLWSQGDLECAQVILDESFADCLPGHSLLSRILKPRHVVLKSFGKFWGLAGLRLGFVIGHPDVTTRLSEIFGPWDVSGPALDIGTRALQDKTWAEETCERLATDAERLDALMACAGHPCIGGTPLFRLYDTSNAKAFQDKLAEHHIWSRIFPYSDSWVRLGLPAPEGWARLEQALA